MRRFTKKDLPSFKLFLRRQGLKETTIKKHFSKLKHLLPHLNTIDQFFDRLHEKNYANGYIKDFVCVIRRIGQFTNNKKFKTYPFPKRTTRYIRATMSQEEIEAFLNLPAYGRQSREDYYKYTILFKIMAYTSMRPGEAAHLTTDQVDFGRGVFLIEDSKTNRPRLVPIPPILVSELEKYIAKLNSNLLFPKKLKTEKPISNVEWQYAFQRRIERLGIKRSNLVPYSLRHSFATRMIEADVNIFKVKSLLGHSNIKTTEIYYHSSTKALKETIKQDPLTLKKEGKITCPFCQGKGFVLK